MAKIQEISWHSKSLWPSFYGFFSSSSPFQVLYFIFLYVCFDSFTFQSQQKDCFLVERLFLCCLYVKGSVLLYQQLKKVVFCFLVYDIRHIKNQDIRELRNGFLNFEFMGKMLVLFYSPTSLILVSFFYNLFYVAVMDVQRMCFQSSGLLAVFFSN